MPIPLLIGAGVLGAKALAGIGMGYGASRIGENEDYGYRDALLDGGLGAIGLPGFTSGRAAYRGGRIAYGVANSGGAKGAAKGLGSTLYAGGSALRNNGLRYALKGGAVGMIPFTAGSTLGSIGGQPVQGPIMPVGRAVGPMQGPVQQQPSMESLLGQIEAVPVNFSNRQAPTFNKTLQGFLRDKDLNGLVGQQIFQMNVPLLEANKAEKTNRNRKVNTNTQLGASLQKAYTKTLAAQKAAHEADAARADNRAALLKQQTADAEAQVPITYLEGEASKAKGEAGSAMANEQSMADALVDRLASQGQQYLEQLKLAESSQTRVNEQAINNAATDAIRANAGQIRANQAQRGSLLGTLASEQYKNAIDLYNLNMDAFNNSENRRFQQAVSNAEITNAANTANAQLGLDTVKALSENSGKGNEAADKRGSARLLELQKKLDTARTKMVKDPLGKAGEVPYSSTKAGKKQIKDLRQRIAVIKERYQTGPL